MDWLGWIWNDLPRRLTVAGLVLHLAVSAVLVWWVSRHYVSSPATGWQLTTWERAIDAEHVVGQKESRLQPESWDDPRLVS